MNPEEGNLRPQLLDRFGMVVDVTAEEDVDKRIQIVKNRLAYEQDASVFCKRFEERQAHLRTKIDKARALLPEVTMSRELRACPWRSVLPMVQTDTAQISES